MNIPKEYLGSLTDEQKERAEAARTPEEFLAIAKETGYQISEEQLNAMSGGWGSDCGDKFCPVDA